MGHRDIEIFCLYIKYIYYIFEFLMWADGTRDGKCRCMARWDFK